MATLTAGQSATFVLDAWATLSLVVSGSATVSFTSLAPNVHPSYEVTVAKTRSYGPHGCPMTVVVTAVDRSMTYVVTGTPEGKSHDSNENIVDPRDWTGFDLTGEEDNSAILQAAIDAASYSSNQVLGYAVVRKLMLPKGRMVFTSQLVIGQSLWMEGVYGVDGGSMLWWEGANATHAIATSNTSDVSYCTLKNFRLEDRRAGQTSGRGISLTRVKNGANLRGLQVFHFPSEQVYVGADSGQSSDCVSLDDIWVTDSNEVGKGILLERIDNNVSLHNIKSDITTPVTDDGYTIRCQLITNDNAVIDISNVKHESDNRCPTLTFPQTTRGNLSIRNIVQRNPSGGAAGAGDVVQFGAAAGVSSFYYDNTSTGITTGSSSEGGGRVLMENLTGLNHSDWTGATGAAMIRGVGTGAVVYGYVQSAILGSSGRFVRSLAGNSSPQGAVYGNVGDRYTRLDATSATCGNWVKQSGAASTSGWAPLTPDTQSVSFSASLSVNFNSGNRVTVGTLTAAITHNAPTNIPVQGIEVVYDFTQDGTGGYGITWSSLHKGSWPTGSGTTGQKKTVVGRSDGTNLLFCSDSGWY